MSTRRARSPAEKKALDYRKNRTVHAEYPHAFRKQWPRKKARSHRKYRRQSHQSLFAVIPRRMIADEIDDVQQVPVQRDRVKKWTYRGMSTLSLRELVLYRLQRRAEVTLASFFKEPYTPDRHREKFSHFLASITSSHSLQVRIMAELLGRLLDAPMMVKMGRFQRLQRRCAWLDRFLIDEPAWEPRLRAWIASFDDRLQGRSGG